MNTDFKLKQRFESVLAENEELIKMFLPTLDGLNEKSVRGHLGNLDYFLNDFLLVEKDVRGADGILLVPEFLGDFVPRELDWATPTTIRSFSITLRRFYKCMADCGKIERDEYESLCRQIEEGMDTWKAACEGGNDWDDENYFMAWH